MSRMDPWINKKKSKNKIYKIYLRIDSVTGCDEWHGVAVVGQSYWNSQCYCCGCGGNSLNWRFDGKGVFLGSTTKGNMPAVGVVGQIIGIEINFKNNTVGFKLFKNKYKKKPMAKYVTDFPAMLTEDIAICWSVRNTGWKVTLISK